MKHTFEEATKILHELGFETHYHSGDKTMIGMTFCCDNRGKNVPISDATIIYNIQYYIDKDEFELNYNVKRWTFTLQSGMYSDIDREDIGLIMFDFFLYCKGLKQIDNTFN